MQKELKRKISALEKQNRELLCEKQAAEVSLPHMPSVSVALQPFINIIACQGSPSHVPICH